MVSAKKIVFFLVFAVFLVTMVFGRPQDLSPGSDVPEEQKNGEVKPAEKEDLKTANSYGFGYGYGFGYPYGYYGLYGLGYGYPYYGYYGAYGYPFYG